MRFGESVFEKGNRTFSKEFKLSCIKRVLEDGEQKIQVALNSNIDPGTLNNWIKKYKKNNGKLNKNKLLFFIIVFLLSCTTTIVYKSTRINTNSLFFTHRTI